MTDYHTQDVRNVQVEIRESGYQQHMEYPMVEVQVWESLSESYSLVFEEVDPVRETLAPAGSLIGRIPKPVTTALEQRGYEIAD